MKNIEAEVGQLKEELRQLKEMFTTNIMHVQITEAKNEAALLKEELKEVLDACVEMGIFHEWSPFNKERIRKAFKAVGWEPPKLMDGPDHCDPPIQKKLEMLDTTGMEPSREKFLTQGEVFCVTTTPLPPLGANHQPRPDTSALEVTRLRRSLEDIATGFGGLDPDSYERAARNHANEALTEKE